MNVRPARARRYGTVGLGLLAAAMWALSACSGHVRPLKARPGASRTGPVNPGPPVRRGDFLASDDSGRVRILDRRGNVVRRFQRRLPSYGLQAISLTPDRRHAFVAVAPGDRTSHLYLVDLTTGHKREIANGISPAISPDHRRLAYVATTRRHDIVYRTALVVRELRTNRIRSIPLGPHIPVGTPPDNVINWSPDGRRIAIYIDSRIRLVDIGPGRLVLSPPVAPRYWNAPVFLARHTVIALANCCIGPQRLIAIDLRSGVRRRFVVLPAPPETIRPLRRGVLLVVTALRELMIASRNQTTVIGHGISVADK